jgi:hypothetical protein
MIFYLYVKHIFIFINRKILRDIEAEGRLERRTSISSRSPAESPGRNRLEGSFQGAGAGGKAQAGRERPHHHRERVTM